MDKKNGKIDKIKRRFLRFQRFLSLPVVLLISTLIYFSSLKKSFKNITNLNINNVNIKAAAIPDSKYNIKLKLISDISFPRLFTILE